MFWGQLEVTRRRWHPSVGVLGHRIPFLTSDRACGGTSAFRVRDEATSGNKCRADTFVRRLHVSPRSVQQEGWGSTAADKWYVFLYKYFYEHELFLETHKNCYRTCSKRPQMLKKMSRLSTFPWVLRSRDATMVSQFPVLSELRPFLFNKSHREMTFVK